MDCDGRLSVVRTGCDLRWAFDLSAHDSPMALGPPNLFRKSSLACFTFSGQILCSFQSTAFPSPNLASSAGIVLLSTTVAVMGRRKESGAKPALSAVMTPIASQ